MKQSPLFTQGMAAKHGGSLTVVNRGLGQRQRLDSISDLTTALVRLKLWQPDGHSSDCPANGSFSTHTSASGWVVTPASATLWLPFQTSSPTFKEALIPTLNLL